MDKHWKKNQKIALKKLVKLMKKGRFDTFFPSILNKLADLKPADVKQILSSLVHEGNIKPWYRVYNAEDPDMYVDFNSKKQIPFGGNVDYKPTGDEFYVSKYNPAIETYYRVTKKGRHAKLV